MRNDNFLTFQRLNIKSKTEHSLYCFIIMTLKFETAEIKIKF